MLERYPSRRARRMSPGSSTAPRAAICAGETRARSRGRSRVSPIHSAIPACTGNHAGEAGTLDDLKGVRHRHDLTPPRAVAPDRRAVLGDAGRQPGRGRSLVVLGDHPEGGELGAAGHVQEPEPDAGVRALRESELRHRLVQERLEVGVPVEAVEQLEGEAVLGDVGGMADREGLLALGRRELGEPLVGAADRVEGEVVVEETLPGGPDRLAGLARGERRGAGSGARRGRAGRRRTRRRRGGRPGRRPPPPRRSARRASRAGGSSRASGEPVAQAARRAPQDETGRVRASGPPAVRLPRAFRPRTRAAGSSGAVPSPASG